MSDSGELEETLALDRDAAAKLAEQFRPGQGAKNQTKKMKDIPHSLLSAEHIRDVVLETGLISPFYTSSHRKSRLKKAAYEGRIGDRAFMYDPNGNLVQIFSREEDDWLKVPQNQIIFVESDIDFRLPEFIALRFNLQIQHVHRGLLLGTGPLVDPGYWGKLCIPLHNLTDHDYHIPKDEGLIWLEFTKTTSSPNRAKNPLGRPPLGGDFWDDITKFLTKASKQFGYDQVPIRSALPSMFGATKNVAIDAGRAAEKAKKSAEFIRNVGVAAAVGVGVMLFQLWQSYYSDMNEQFDVVRPQIEVLRSELDDHVGRIERISQEDAEAALIIPDLRNQLQQQEEENAILRDDLERLEADVRALQIDQ